MLVGNAECFGAFLPSGEIIAFNSFRTQPHAIARDIKIGHRLVVLPDYQGLGIGWKFDEWVGEMLHRRGWRYHTTTSHAAMISAFLRSPRWRCLGGTKVARSGNTKHAGLKRQQNDIRRMGTQSFAYCHPAKMADWMDLSGVINT